MNRDEIYDHLAQVYLGKRSKAEEKKKKQFHAWLTINIVITVIILASAFYGLTAFLKQKVSSFENSIIFSLHNGPSRMEYDFEDPFPPTKSFSLSIPKMDVTKYSKINFAIRAKEEGSPGIVKIILKNQKDETAYRYIQGIDLKWKEYSIPLEEFKQITDWTNLTEVTFILESWNVDKRKGMILIGDVSFSG